MILHQGLTYRLPFLNANWCNNSSNTGFSGFHHFSACYLSNCLHGGCDTSAAVSPPTKLFVLVLSAENNKALNPGRAEKPHVPCSLSSKSSFASFSLKALTFRGPCLLPHLWGSWVIMDGDYWVWWAAEDLKWLLGKQRGLPARAACWISTLTQLFCTLKNPLTKRLNKGPQGPLNQRTAAMKESSILVLYKK